MEKAKASKKNEAAGGNKFTSELWGSQESLNWPLDQLVSWDFPGLVTAGRRGGREVLLKLYVLQLAVFRDWLNHAVQIPVSLILYHRPRSSCMVLCNSGSVVFNNDAKSHSTKDCPTSRRDFMNLTVVFLVGGAWITTTGESARAIYVSKFLSFSDTKPRPWWMNEF